MTLHNATHQQLVQLSRLRDPEFAPLLEFLRSERDVTQSALATAEGYVAVYRLQGMLLAYRDFLKAVDDAPELLRRAAVKHGTPSAGQARRP
jgi:hypothetical protein